MAPHVREVQVPVVPDCHPVRLVELDVPRHEKIPGPVEDHHLVVTASEQVNVVLAVRRDARYLKELVPLRQRPPALNNLIRVFPDLISH